MKKCRILLLFLFLFLLSGCASDYIGTWCLFVDTPSDLVILTDNVTQSDKDKITNYITKNITNLKSYDYIESLDNANEMLTIYYTSEDNVATYETTLNSLSGVKSVEYKVLNTAHEKLDITNSSFTYGTNLDALSASETKGTYQISGQKITLNGNQTFYYKDKFLCYDESCNQVLTKSKTNNCNN